MESRSRREIHPLSIRTTETLDLTMQCIQTGIILTTMQSFKVKTTPTYKGHLLSPHSYLLYLIP